MKKNAIVISIFILILLSSCINFQTINQPSVSLPNEIITVSITATTRGGEHEPYFGVCLPIGWTIPGDSLQCSGGYNEVIYYDVNLSIEQENVSPADQGYYWWAGMGVADTSAVGEVYADLLIQTDSQTGQFSIDYMLGDGYGGINNQRSDNHLIDIVNEYTPGGLQYSVMGDSVMLNWMQPFNINGLRGYKIYRDEQQINSILVVDTSYFDENPLEGMHYYSISSVYDNGNEYLISYEILVVFKNLYVSPTGNNINNGSSFNDALLTITYAMSVITIDSLSPITISLAPGTYSANTNGEEFPISCIDYITISGSGEDKTIIDANSQNRVLEVIGLQNISMNGLTIEGGMGEGIYCWGYANLSLRNVTIKNNQGTGLFYYGEGHGNSTLNLENVTIKNNQSNDSGGGLSYYVAGDENSTLNLENVTIKNNQSNYSGGGLSSISAVEITTLNLVNVKVLNNTAENSGGMQILRSNVNLTNVLVSSNSGSEMIGGIGFGGPVNVLLENVTITDNSAPLAGGIWCYNDSATAKIDFTNCVLWNNTPEEIYLLGETDDRIEISVAFSNIHGGEAGIIANGNTVNWLEDNIDEDPLFIDAILPYTLSGGSPCIDAGNPDITYNDPEDPNNLGYALLPAMGTLRNDMGAYGGPNAASWNIVVGIDDEETKDFEIPIEFELAQNYPNPFNPSTTIQYGIKEKSSVELILYDILGRQVVILVNEELDAGYYKVNFNATSLPSGIYFYRLQAVSTGRQAGSFVETRKMVLMK